MSYIITDEKGYWVSRQQGVDFWSTQLRDAAIIHFYAAAVKLAERLPMETKIEDVG